MANTDWARIIFQKNSNKWIGSIQIDAFLNESIVMAATSSSFPIEDGSTISDQIINENPELTIRGIVGPAQIYDILTLATNRIQDVYDQLVVLRESKELFTVVCGLSLFDDMYLANFTINRDKDTGGCLLFEGTFKQLNIVTLRNVTIPNTRIGTKQAKAPVSAGKVTSGQTLTPLQNLQTETFLGVPKLSMTPIGTNYTQVLP